MTKETILVVGHGTRYPGGNQESDQFVERWRSQNPEKRIELCYIEFADILLGEGLDRAATQSKRVVVVPLILNAAAHVKIEIPEAISEARHRHPDIEFIYAKHLGINETILKVVNRQIKSVMQTLHHPDPHGTGMILLGRGSSDRVANSEIAKLARWIYEENNFLQVDYAFTGVTFPRLEAVVQKQIKLGMAQIIIQPFYLFAGRLIDRIEKQHESLAHQYPHIRFGLGERFGFAAEIFELLNERIDAVGKKSAMMECDGCPYRYAAIDEHNHGHHHHHH